MLLDTETLDTETPDDACMPDETSSTSDTACTKPDETSSTSDTNATLLMLHEAYLAGQQSLAEGHELLGELSRSGPDAVMDDETAHKKRSAEVQLDSDSD
jgi:hypothetical protein